MNIREAINWAERPLMGENAELKDGFVRYRFVHYYVVPWNDGYSVVPETQIERHPNIEWVYNTREKKVRNGKGKYTGRDYFYSVPEYGRRAYLA